MKSVNTGNFLGAWALCSLVACCALATVPAASAATPKVTTVAGGYVGDGKPAISASFNGSDSVVQDAEGNLYVSDASNCRIRKISLKGIISTVAGTSICGYSGDSGPAKSAMLNAPQGLAFDAKGNLLVADAGNFRVRTITPAGTITTIAGNGTAGYSGDGRAATKASLSFPNSISVDSTGKVYITDASNCVIRRVTTAGIIHTVAGNHTCGFSGDGGPATSAQLNYPNGVLAGDKGTFYIADNENIRVRKVDSTGTITTYAGNGQFGNGGSGGPATAASVGSVRGGLLLGGGKLYFTTAGNIWTVDLSTQIIDIIAGNANGSTGFNGDGLSAIATSFSYPTGITSDAGGNLFVAEMGNDRIRKIDASQTVTTIAGGYLGDGHPAVSASLSTSYFGGHIAFDPQGNLYFADTGYNRVRKVTPAGIITTLAGTGITGYSGDGGPASAATLSLPSAVAADGFGNIYIADSNSLVIRKVDNTGTITTFSNTPAVGLAVDAAGNVYAASGFDGSVIWKITPAGSASIVAGVQFEIGYNGDGIPATAAWLAFPVGVAVDNLGNLYIADNGNNRIRKVDTSGMISTFAGTGVQGFSGDAGPATSAMIWTPLDVAVDTKGDVYFTDTSNFRVRDIDSSGTINTLAGTGNGEGGYNGNDLPATSTNMFPIAVGVSPKGVVYLTDGASYRVRKVH